MKIFDALQKAEGEIPELIRPLLDEAETPSPTRPASPEPGIAEHAPAAIEPEAATEASAARQRAIRIFGPGPLLPFDETDPRAAEQYRIIRTRLLQHPRQPRMLLVSSAGPGDGKSVTALNLAGALSLKSGASTVLADADFRRSTIHTQLGLPRAPGLTDVLTGRATLEEALIRLEQMPNLFVIPAGEPCSNPSELLDSPRWRGLALQMRGLFRHVIADSPPVASVADYELLQATCDGVLLVARPDHTKRTAFLKTLDTIPKEKLIGVVMNCVTDWFLARHSHYGGYYYQANGKIDAAASSLRSRA